MYKEHCKHYQGIMEKSCGANVDWDKMFGSVCGCIKKEDTTCKKFELYTDEEFKRLEEAQELSTKEFIESFKSGTSVCCHAPVDNSRVIKDGQHKNHGPRYCSKCRKLLFVV